MSRRRASRKFLEAEQLHDRLVEALCDKYDEVVELEIERMVEAETERLYEERDEWIEKEIEKMEEEE